MIWSLLLRILKDSIVGMQSVVEQIFRNAELSPQNVALTDGKRSVSYKELSENILSAREVLIGELGLKSGDRIILAANKQLEFVYTYFAAHLLGVIASPIDSETNSGRLDFIIENIAPQVIIGFKKIESDICQLDYDFYKLSEVVNSIEPISFPTPDDVADIIFTTGTTGKPKGVVLTHKNISQAAYNINEYIGNTKHDIELLALPISHSFGLGRLRCVLSRGGMIILLGSFVNLKRLYRFMEECKVTGFAMVPSSWAFMKKMSGERIGDYADTLRYVEIGSAAMPLEDKQLLMRLLPNSRICMHYGLTEASRSTFIEFNSEASRLSSIGRPSPNVDIKIKGINGNDLPAGSEGEICVKGDSVMSRYLNDLDNIESFFGEYFRTGDWGVLDGEGYITLLSRKKELINVGGKKVSPIEVEEVLNGIEGVEESACIGIADKGGVLGEVVKAYIVITQGAAITFEEINSALCGKLEGYKMPAEYEFISEIPKTSSGKIQRLQLKNR